MRHTIKLIGVCLLPLMLLGIVPTSAQGNNWCFDWSLVLPPGNYSVIMHVIDTTGYDRDHWIYDGAYHSYSIYVNGVMMETTRYSPGDGGGIGGSTAYGFETTSTLRVTMKFEAGDNREVYALEVVIDADGTIIDRELQQSQCGVTDEGNSDDNNVVLPPDDRANWQLGDDIAVIFSVNDSENNPALHVYQPNTEGINPNRPLVITRADLSHPMPPAQDTWIAGEGLVNVYVLTTGEIQFNIGPTPDGKVRVVIFPDFTGDGAYGYEYFVDEQMPASSNETATITSDDNPAADVLCRFLVLSSDC